jgi:putative tryptophan/tyrosine transport system substrate-binding protein
MRRRDLFALVGCTSILVPFQSTAQSKVARVGWLPFSDPKAGTIWPIFVAELRNRGWVEGRNLEFDIRPVEGHVERYPEIAAELVALHPDVIIANGSAGTQAVREKTSTIPIIMIGADDPVRLGFVTSLAHPGGNITGISNQGADIFEKAFELLSELRPGMKRVVLLYAPAFPASRLCKTILEASAPRHGLMLDAVALNAPAELDSSLATVAHSRPDALIVHDTPITVAHTKDIAAFAAEHRLLSFSYNVATTDNGLLMSYSPDWEEIFRRAAALIDKILRGGKSADIPVEQPTKFLLRLNQRTADAIGVEFPPSLRARADEVID